MSSSTTQNVKQIKAHAESFTSNRIEMTVIEIDQALTVEDKKLLGWPFQDDADFSINQIALFIALDRTDGYLTGPITQEYLIGNQEKAIPGLHERNPGITKSSVVTLLEQLKQSITRIF